MTRPVSTIGVARAAVSWALEAPGKLVKLNMKFAGSKSVLKPMLIPGTICCDEASAFEISRLPPTHEGMGVALPGQRLVDRCRSETAPGRPFDVCQSVVVGRVVMAKPSPSANVLGSLREATFDG